MKPLVSVLIPAYNAEKTIQKSIKSVKNQTYPNWELIIINDGSNDKTEQLIINESLNDSRIKYKSQINKGLVQTRKELIKSITGGYWMFLDADDLLHPQAIELLLQVALNNNVDIVMTAGIQNMSRKFEIGKSNKYYNNLEKIEIVDAKDLINNFLMYPKYNVCLTSKLYSSILKNISFDNVPELFVGEDTIMNATIFSNCRKIAVVYEDLYNYRYGGGSGKYYPSLSKDIKELYYWRKKFILDNQLGNSILKESIINIICIFNSLSGGNKINGKDIYPNLEPILIDAKELNINHEIINIYSNLAYENEIEIKKEKEPVLIKI